MTTITSESVSTDAGQVERKPLMSGPAILMMNLGFFGVQFSFGLTQSAVNPLFLLIGANPDQLPIFNLAGPVTGLVIQPLIGAAMIGPGALGGAAAARSSPLARSSARSSCLYSRLSAFCGWPWSASGSSTPATTPPWSRTGHSSPTGCLDRNSRAGS